MVSLKTSTQQAGRCPGEVPSSRGRRIQLDRVADRLVATRDCILGVYCIFRYLNFHYLKLYSQILKRIEPRSYPGKSILDLSLKKTALRALPRLPSALSTPQYTSNLLRSKANAEEAKGAAGEGRNVRRRATQTGGGSRRASVADGLGVRGSPPFLTERSRVTEMR